MGPHEGVMARNGVTPFSGVKPGGRGGLQEKKKTIKGGVCFILVKKKQEIKKGVALRKKRWIQKPSPSYRLLPLSEASGGGGRKQLGAEATGGGRSDIFLRERRSVPAGSSFPGEWGKETIVEKGSNQGVAVFAQRRARAGRAQTPTPSSWKRRGGKGERRDSPTTGGALRRHFSCATKGVLPRRRNALTK